jgi:hypothetical protein
MTISNHLDLVGRLPVFLLLPESFYCGVLAYLGHRFFNGGGQLRSFDLPFLGRARSGDEKPRDQDEDPSGYLCDCILLEPQPLGFGMRKIYIFVLLQGESVQQGLKSRI